MTDMKRLVIDPIKAEENLLQAALQYAEAIARQRQEVKTQPIKRPPTKLLRRM